jgi:hypothetical protein
LSDLIEYMTFAKELALQVGNEIFLPAYNRNQDKLLAASSASLEYETKGGNLSDLVTVTDKTLERLIKEKIHQKYPNHKYPFHLIAVFLAFDMLCFVLFCVFFKFFINFV